jgi:hypothetical protein
MAFGQTPRYNLPEAKIVYAEGDTISAEIADFDGTNVSSWDFECDVYQQDTKVITLSSSNGDFTVKGTDSDILQVDLSSSQTNNELSLDTDENEATAYEGVVKALNAGLTVDPWRFLILKLQVNIYDAEN